MTYAALAETHTSVVFFVGDRAFKVKKPVDLGFLDNRTREARLRSCKREVELNRRMAPDVYLGIDDVYGVDGKLADHLVVMRRLPAERRLSALVERGEDITDVLTDIARQVAELHRVSPHSDEIDHFGRYDSLVELWTSSLDHIAILEAGQDHLDVLAQCQGMATTYLSGRKPLLARRIADHRIVDGHGDMLVDDIFCLEDGARVIDCLEFFDAFRYGDGMLDAAFLAMDLEQIGVPESGEFFLDEYRRFAGDDCPDSLVHHYIAYRALIRTKVAALRYDQGESSAKELASHFIEIMHHHLQRARVRMVLVGGLSGSGKTTLAANLAQSISAVVLSSDNIRKELSGLSPSEDATAPVDGGIYSYEMSTRTYATMISHASALLEQGTSVVLDATWLSEKAQDAARTAAAKAFAELIELEAIAPEKVLRERILSRRAGGGDASDATLEVLEHQIEQKKPWPQSIKVDTTDDSIDVMSLLN